MPKKGRKTKEDEKGNAFERLYAFLAATNQTLPPLENSHLSIEKKKEPTPEEIAKEKAKEKAEFDKLYAQLSSLSARRPEETVPLITQTTVQEPSIANVSTVSNEFNEVYEQIIRIITMKSQMQPQMQPAIQSPIKHSKIIPQCTACHKIFSTKGSLIRHRQTTTVCQKWLALPEDQQLPMIDKPIHMISDDYLKQATTGDKPFQCRFCSITFTNRGNHNKHYQSALICNRMAYIEYKRLVSQ
jgi:hypothetical protein